MKITTRKISENESFKLYNDSIKGVIGVLEEGKR